MASPSESQPPVVNKPCVEFLLKQVYTAYKEEVKTLTDNLLEAKAELSKRNICTFCTTLIKQVEALRGQVKQLLQERQVKQLPQERPQVTKNDVHVQTDQMVLFPHENGTKRTIIFSSPRKKANASVCKSRDGKAKIDVVDMSKSDDDIVLVPSTPERNPQREGRVNRWLKTMEIPETVDPDVLLRNTYADKSHRTTSMPTGKIVSMLPLQTDPAANYNCHKTENSIDMDATMLPSGFQNINAIQRVSKEFEAKEEEMDMDATMLPLGYSDKNDISIDQHDPNDRSSVSSEDLLDGAVSLKNENSTRENILQDVGNRTHKTHSTRDRRQENLLPYKYKSEPVRKKLERKRLPAQQCADCANYFSDANGQQRRDICSRHRALHAAPATPEHFWDLDFPDTQECKERGYLNATLKSKVESRRRRPFK